MLTNTSNSKFSKATPLEWDAVTWTDGLWAEVESVCAKGTIPHIQKMFESAEISHVVENFKICAGEKSGSFGGTDFGDGDFYKWMEAAIYIASKEKDKLLLTKIDEYIELIGRCQQPDGYISTKQIIGERQKNGIARFGDINDFEVYNFGHLFTTASLHYRITKKRNFLDIAEKAAEYLNQMYLENARTGHVQTAVCPSHYMGLLELYRTTSNEKYLKLAKLSIELRDLVENGTDDNQDKIPLKKHEKIVGHAVRSNYLYAGVADLYIEEGDSEYKDMLDKVWSNLIHQKLYITGGCGALYNGSSPYGNFFDDAKVHQAYGYEYQLPNVTAYNETCAAIGNVMWAYRMFQIDPKAEYFDIIERTMLNINLAAMNLTGDKFFYENMLRRTTDLPYELIWPLTRKEYIMSFCCPPNLARILAESSEYAYLTSDNSLWIGMYGANQSDITMKNNTHFSLHQETEYPFDGKIRLELTDISSSNNFFINIRIPSWVQQGYIKYENENLKITSANSGTYLSIEVQKDKDNLLIEINFDMTTRMTMSHPYVEETTNQVAVERGPLVYCLESADCDLETIENCLISSTAKFKPVNISIENRNIIALQTELTVNESQKNSKHSLYHTLNHQEFKKTKARLIPYFAWDNRGFGEMKVWLPLIYQNVEFSE